MAAYYNELDPFAAQWLRNLIKAGHIAPGDVDERDIRDVRPSDVAGYSQCHFFAGIGIWSYALRLAKWADERPVWTGSCPCQPFSAAGRGLGVADERHLWPHWFHLINQCGPPVLFGEQVASKDGLVWLDLVHADLEGAGYAIGAIDCCAAGLGAPHIRQRLWIMAHNHNDRRPEDTQSADHTGKLDIKPHSIAYQLAHSHGQCERPTRPYYARTGDVIGTSEARQLGDASGQGLSACKRPPIRATRGREEGRAAQQSDRAPDQNKFPGPVNGVWGSADWINCRDGRWRPIEPGSFPLADGASARVGRLRAYGNAIAAPVARAFIEIAQECLP